MLILHPRFNLTGTRGTRLSSDNPNAQNVGKKPEVNLRAVFGPRPYYEWYLMDYNQLEARIMAVVSQDERMLAIFSEGRDMHLETACAIYGPTDGPQHRAHGKTTNFAKQYGGGWAAIKRADPSLPDSECRRFDAAYNVTYPGVIAYGQRMSQEVRRKKYVETLFGYRLYVTEPKDAANYVVQGTAGQLAKRAMIKWYTYLKTNRLDAFLLLNVHDELVLEASQYLTNKATHISALKRAMESSDGFIKTSTPVEVFLATESWDKKEAYIP